jgi:formylglycine-generating enzyme required for sulfatase activity
MIKVSHFTLLIFLAVRSALAQVDIGMEFVDVGDAGNPPDPFTEGLIGSVPYPFKMGKYEVTNEQYVGFLNDVDPLGTNSLLLYVGSMAGPRGGITFDLARGFGEKYQSKPSRDRHPVTFLSYFSALRFVNWLHGGDTETGAYTMPVNDLEKPERNLNARFWIPNKDEWHKAAYYNGPNSTLRETFGTDYSLYPMKGFVAIASKSSETLNAANFQNVVGDFVPVGSYPLSFSYYGTADQGGNAEEWYDRDGTRPSWLGGSYRDSENSLQAGGGNGTTTDGNVERGFRVATFAAFEQPSEITTLEIRKSVELSWQGEEGVTYQIQGSSDGKTWIDTGDPIIGGGEVINSLQSIRNNRNFYRVIISR